MTTYERILSRLMTDSIDVDVLPTRLPEFPGSRCVTLRADESNPDAVVVRRDDREQHLQPGCEITFGLHDRPHLTARAYYPSKLLYKAS